VGYFEQALEALTHLPPDRPMLEQAVDLRLRLCGALVPFAHWEQILTHMREAETVAAALGDQHRLGRVCRRMANTLRQMQDHEPTLAYCQRAHAIATALGDVETQVAVYQDMGTVYHDLGQYRQAMEHFQQILKAFPKIPSDQVRRGIVHPAIQARVWLLQCHRELGEFADGVASGKAARQMAEAGGRPYDRVAVYLRLGRLQMRQGTLDQAIPLLEQAMALSQEADMPNLYRLAAASLALAYALAGRATDALAVLGLMSGKPPYPNTSLIWGEVYLRVGHVEEAHRLTQEVLTDTRRLKERGWEARAL
jgi:tetratricopeptide (TPR) repeat protein